MGSRGVSGTRAGQGRGVTMAKHQEGEGEEGGSGIGLDIPQLNKAKIKI